LDNVGLAFGLVTAAGLSTAIGAAAVFERRVVKLASKPVLAAGLGFSAGVMIYVSFVEIFGKASLAFEVAGYEKKAAYCFGTICFFAGMVMLRLISCLVHLIDKDHHCACDADCIDEACEASDASPHLISSGESASPPASEAAAVAAAPAAGEGNGQQQQQSPPQFAEATKDAENPQDTKQDDAKISAAKAKANADAKKLQKMGLNTAMAIGIHNFPEGLATFVATLADPNVGVTLAIAIGIHNIPEGLCVALPIYYATNSRLKGFLWALLSGISEPIGALIGYAIIKSTGDDMSQIVYGVLFGLVAGMMVMIVMLELLPTAYRYDPKDRFVTTSAAAGMLVMALSLVMFKL